MTNPAPTFAPADGVGLRTLELALPRAVKFLAAAGTNPFIFGSLATLGFTEADLAEGWAMVTDASKRVVSPVPVAPSRGAAALAQLTSFASQHFPPARSALHRLFPEQEQVVFGQVDLNPETGPIVEATLVLDGIDELEHGSSRKGTRKADHEAVAILEKRGLSRAARESMREWIKIVETSGSTRPPAPSREDEERIAALRSLHAWLADWSECARSVIQRRDVLIRMGIGKRKLRTPKPPPVAPAPSTSAGGASKGGASA